MDQVNLYELESAGWSGEAECNAARLREDFAAYLREHKDEITALRIFFEQPYPRREVTCAMVSGLLARLHGDRPNPAPLRVWQAYAQLDRVAQNGTASLGDELLALVSDPSGHRHRQHHHPLRRGRAPELPDLDTQAP